REAAGAAERLLRPVELALLQALLALGHEGEAEAVEVEDVPLDPQPADLREATPGILGVARALRLQVGRPESLEARAGELGPADVDHLLGGARGERGNGEEAEQHPRERASHAPLTRALATYPMRSSKSRPSSSSSSAAVRRPSFLSLSISRIAMIDRAPSRASAGELPSGSPSPAMSATACPASDITKPEKSAFSAEAPEGGVGRLAGDSSLGFSAAGGGLGRTSSLRGSPSGVKCLRSLT